MNLKVNVHHYMSVWFRILEKKKKVLKVWECKVCRNPVILGIWSTPCVTAVAGVLGHSAESAGGRLQLNTPARLTH